MSIDEFQSVEDVHDAVRALQAFADDSVFAIPFEYLCLYPDCYSNLMNVNDERRLMKLADRISPGLDAARKNTILEESLKKLPNDIQDLLSELETFSREAFLTIGIFMGARIADPSGKALENLSRGWVRAILAQGRHENLPKKKKRSEQEAFLSKYEEL